MGFEFIMRRYPLMFCPHCGNNVADNTKFCPYCGATMEQQAPAAAPQQNSVPNYGAPQQTPYVPNYAAAQKAAKPKYMNPIALIAAAVTLIAMFLPFMSVSAFGYSQSVSFFDCMGTGDPMIWLILLMVAVVVILQLVKAPQVPSIVLAALSLVFLLIEIGVAANQLGEFSSMVSYSLGFWLMLVGLIVIIVSGPIYKAIFKK